MMFHILCRLHCSFYTMYMKKSLESLILEVFNKCLRLVSTTSRCYFTELEILLTLIFAI